MFGVDRVTVGEKHHEHFVQSRNAVLHLII